MLGTILICVNQNFTLLETVAFSLGSGLGYLFAVAVVDEGRRRLRSKDVPAIFTGMPISLTLHRHPGAGHLRPGGPFHRVNKPAAGR